MISKKSLESMAQYKKSEWFKIITIQNSKVKSSLFMKIKLMLKMSLNKSNQVKTNRYKKCNSALSIDTILIKYWQKINKTDKKEKENSEEDQNQEIMREEDLDQEKKTKKEIDKEEKNTKSTINMIVMIMIEEEIDDF